MRSTQLTRARRRESPPVPGSREFASSAAILLEPGRSCGEKLLALVVRECPPDGVGAGVVREPSGSWRRPRSSSSLSVGRSIVVFSLHRVADVDPVPRRPVERDGPCDPARAESDVEACGQDRCRPRVGADEDSTLATVNGRPAQSEDGPQALEENGWTATRGGKHAVKMEKQGERPITLPRHKGEDYGKGLTAAILKAAGLD